VLAEAVQERSLNARGQPLAEQEHTYSVHFSFLLGLGGARRGEQGNSDDQDKDERTDP
jgi:hypothetical protein